MRLSKSWIPLAGCAVAIGLSVLFLGPAAGQTHGQHREVLRLKPVGYWPADEGQGDILHDRSGHENHGRIFLTPWDEGFLNFHNGYQWIEIPGNPRYPSTDFTLGGWIISRRTGTNLYLPNFTDFIGNAGVSLALRGHYTPLAVDTPVGSHTIGSLEWVHVLCVHDQAGGGKLYVNGEMVAAKRDAAAAIGEGGFRIGCRGNWFSEWGPQSLDGSIRDLVVFDRALSAGEMKRLHASTKPDLAPVYADDLLVIRGRRVPLKRLAQLPVEDRRLGLETLETRDAARLQQISAELLPLLAPALEPWQTRRVAASLLVKLDRDEARIVLRDKALPLFIRTVRDAGRPREERVASAMGLVEMGKLADDAVPALADVLEDILQREGAHLPRIEDLLRNAVMRALLVLGPEDERARRGLGLALAKPVFDSLDMSESYLDDVRPLVAEGRYMDALDAYRRLPGDQRGGFLSQGDPGRDARNTFDNQTAYTPTANFEGYAYRVGAGKPWGSGEPRFSEMVEKVSEDEHKRAIAELAAEYPEAKDWRPAGHGHLYRVPITQTDPQGRERTAYLGGKWLILDGSDAKLRGWSITVDKDGYIHLTGGQHNRVNPGDYIPGSWEKMGLSRDPACDDFPAQMYWVSTKPGDIGAFEFVGQRNNPRHIPTDYLNYMNFVNGRDNVPFLYGRINVAGIQSWGLYRYDADRRRWHSVEGEAQSVIQSAEKQHPGWSEYLIRQARGHVPADPGPKAFVWAWQPQFYNFCRGWGVKFDRTDRMHVRMQVQGLGENARLANALVYAWSDDGGHTFHRADGARVELPLTVNPAPDHNADVNNHATARWWELWYSLLVQAGYERPYGH